MGKKIVIFAILIMFLMSTNAAALTEIYSIQLGAYGSEANAEQSVLKMKQKGIDAFKIDTVVHSVFYGAHADKSEALAELPAIKKIVPGAFVTKLSDGQTSAYLKSKDTDAAASNNLTADAAATSEAIAADETGFLKEDKEKQVVVTRKDGNSLEYTYNVLNDIELRGVNGESKWFFNADQDLSVKDFRLNLFCHVTELMRRDLSNVTVYMNKIPVKSLSFNGDGNQTAYSWSVSVPTNLIKKGYNELKLVTQSRISDRACEDDKNTANWVMIDGETNYAIDYDRKYQSEKLADFPEPFIGMHADEDKGIGVVIPDDYSNEEISAALTLIAYLEDYESGYDSDMTLITSSASDLYEYDSLIYIGTYDGMPADLKNFAKAPAGGQDTDIYLYRKSLNDFRKPVFLIVSDQGASLMTAVKALKNSDLKDQMMDSHAVLPKDLNVEIKQENHEDYVYLTDLGLNSIEVQGRNQYTNIGFKIPYNKILADDANLCLNLRYSDNLDFDKSMVSVYINGVPAGSHKLERGKRDFDPVTFHIPAELRQNSYYDIRVVFELIPSGVFNCEQYLSSVPWAYIQDDSYIYAPSQDTPLMLLNRLPYPFSRNDDLDTTKIVLPDNPSREDLKTAGIIAQLIGTGGKKNTGIMYVERGNLFTESNNEDNLIIFGTPAENSAIKKINKNLWFRYNEAYNGVLSNEKIELLPEFSRTAAFIELKASPYNEEKGLLTITSLDKKSLSDLFQYLHLNKMSFLTGDAVIVSKDGDFQTFRFQKDVERPFYEISVLKNANSRNYIIFAASIVLLMILGLILFLNKNRRRRT